MCGFLTWITKEKRLWNPDELKIQRESLSMIEHRGPDDSSADVEDGFWFGFQRLAILDLSECGRQPMTFGGGRFSQVFNGEIYNFKELRKGLGSVELASSGDSVVLGSLLASRPLEGVLAELRGMFAFSWWDRENQELVAARDPFGIKPLYYTQNAQGDMLVGSELRALKNLAHASAEISKKALAEFFRWGAVQSPNSMLGEVKCLPPGHYLKWKNGELEIQRYFTPQWPGQAGWITDPVEQRALMKEGFLSSLKAHLIADVPVGVFLSGGIDSTLMAAGMKHLGCEEIQAFSIGYEDEAGVPDETDAAFRTAEFLGCEFVRERVSSKSLFESLDDYFASLDQPSGDALNTWLVSRLAAKEVKVAVSGLGADEWFGGYNYMRLVALASKLSAGAPLQAIAGPMIAALGKGLPPGIQSKQIWKAVLYASGGAGTKPSEWYETARSIFDCDEVAKTMGVSTAQVSDWTVGSEWMSSLFDEVGSRAPDSRLNQLLLLETEGYLANTLLRDNDGTSMAHSLELRVPLVDPEIFRLAGRLSPSCKAGLDGGKKILRESMKELLPSWIAEDKKKKTFTLPLMKWMRKPDWQDRIQDVLGSQACKNRGWVEPKEVSRILETYRTTGIDNKGGWKLSQQVWMLFVLESWAEQNLSS